MKEITYTNRKRGPVILKDANGKLILDKNQKLRRGTEYTNELFGDNRIGNDSKNINSRNKNCSKNSKISKAIVPIETLKWIKEDSLGILLDVFNELYKTGHLNTLWAIPKPKTLMTAVNTEQYI